MRRKFALTGLAALATLILACSDKTADPLSPTGDVGAGANAEGETLKVTAPTPISPVNDQQPTLLTLTASAAELKFVGQSALQYNFEVYNSANVRVVNDTDNSPSHTVTTPLDFGKRYTWRVRATSNGSFGPFSSTASFIAPAGGYNTAGELYDPLVNGKSVGTVNGLVDFLPGVGVRLNDNNAYIDYLLPATITDGEISAVVTNLCSCSGQPGIKTKIFAMSQGYDELSENDRRFTVEKRSGSDKGIVAWRFITRATQIDTEGSEREFVQFNPTTNYLWKASYRNNYFNLTIDELGGGRVYEFGKSYDGTYNPTPHVAFIGSPPVRGGPGSGTVAGMIVRHLWVSSRERPAAITQ